MSIFKKKTPVQEPMDLEAVMKKLKGMELTIEGEDAARAAEFAQKVEDEFNACMSDDFNTALALSNLFGYFKDIKKWLKKKNLIKLEDLFSSCYPILIVWLVTGIWHGAAWNFIIWGLYFAVLLFFGK